MSDAILRYPLTALRGVGEGRVAKLEGAGIGSIGDLLEYFPRDYLDRSEISPIDEINPGQTVVVRGRFGEATNMRHGNLTVTRATFRDKTGGIDMVWFNQPYMAKNLGGGEYICAGKATIRAGRLAIESPDYERVQGEIFSAGRIVPIYPLIDGISQKILRPLIRQALDMAGHLIVDFLPKNILEQFSLMPRADAISNLHFPKDDSQYMAARRRLVFEELFLMQLALANLRGIYTNKPGHRLNIRPTKLSLPFDLTKAQARVYGEISADMASGYAMNRLIQGDVGSGKTAIAMLAMEAAAANGFQSALLAPTETLATQHYLDFLEIFGDKLIVEKLVGSLKKREKDKIKARLAAGEIQIIIGTHALIQDNVIFHNLGLTICDEQHRFGVRQRQKIGEKGIAPHMLVMTATPIPRSLAMVLYGDLNVSIIDEMPPGRQKIDTFAVGQAYHPRIYKFIQEHIDSGEQAYIICPLVETSEKEGMAGIRAVSDFAQELVLHFPNCRLAIIHGRMKADEKNAVMAGFAAGDIHILISTTVVEVGVNVPNATIMLIENAERFGLSQLHQLRGRVGRGQKKSFCILISDSKNKITKERLAAMTRTNDGFELSELDLKLRGPGEFFGTAQHGLPALRLANLYRDLDVLESAKDAAAALIAKDPDISSPAHVPLLKRINQKLGGFGDISL